MTDRSIWILRHAKAAADSAGGDSARTLTGRGRRQADAVRRHIEGLTADFDLPSLILCSPAVRARQTAEHVKPSMARARIEIESVLYTEGASGVLSWLRDLDPDERSLMLVGHNPTLLELCVTLAEPKDASALEDSGLPTAGLVVMSIGASDGWKGLAADCARVVHRFVPER